MLMTRSQFEERFGRHAVIGMIHLHALPGAPAFTSMREVLDLALRDAAALREGGASALMVENFGDRPFFKSRVPAETVAGMTRAVVEIAREGKLPVGVNVLRNDAASALAIAAATGAAFIRINVLTGAMLTDQGIIESEAASLLRLRAHLAPNVAIFGDHMVKHATPLAPIDEEQAAKDLRLRAGADAIVVSGRETGSAADVSRIEMLRRVTDAPLVIGSGLTAENASHYREIVDGAIVGTSLKTVGIDSPVDEAKVRAVVRVFAARVRGNG